MASKNLVITRAGPNSLHGRWAAGPERNFDVLVAAYDQRAMKRDEPGICHLIIPGPKIEGWQRVFELDPGLVQRYERFAFIDDDIDTTATDLHKCFAFGEEFGLSIWQPSLTWNSYFTFGFTLRNPLFRLRYVNYIEMMCPFFTAEALIAALPLFSLGLETGIDLIWCSLLANRIKRFAVVDDVVVRHTRPIGFTKVSNGFASATYEDHIFRCLQLFDTPWPSAITYCGLSRHNREVAHRLLIAAKTVAISIAMLCGEHRGRVRPILDHIRHQLFRRPLYVANARARLNELEIARTRVPSRVNKAGIGFVP